MKRTAIVTAAVVALSLAGGGIALAATASIPDSSGVIHACYQSPPPAHGANLAVIDTDKGGNCAGGQVELSWNQTGPQGPPGTAGVDRGYVTFTHNPDGTVNCALSNLSGPDTGNLTVSVQSGCQIIGLPDAATSVMMATVANGPGTSATVSVSVQATGAGTGWEINEAGYSGNTWTAAFVLFP